MSKKELTPAEKITGTLCDFIDQQAIKYGKDNGIKSIPIVVLTEYLKIIKRDFVKGLEEKPKKFDPYKKPKTQQ